MALYCRMRGVENSASDMAEVGFIILPFERVCKQSFRLLGDESLLAPS